MRGQAGFEKWMDKLDFLSFLFFYTSCGESTEVLFSVIPSPITAVTLTVC